MIVARVTVMADEGRRVDGLHVGQQLLPSAKRIAHATGPWPVELAERGLTEQSAARGATSRGLLVDPGEVVVWYGDHDLGHTVSIYQGSRPIRLL